MNKIIILCISIIILSSLIIFGTYNLKTSPATNTKSKTSYGSFTITPFTSKYLSIAKKSINCLDNLKNSDGLYLYAKACAADGNCQPLPGNQSGPRPIWAQYKYYEVTKDSKRLNIINQDLIDETSKVVTIQNNFWNCKLMSEMYRSSVFNEDQKKMIKSICLNSVNNPSIINQATQVSSNYDINQIESLASDVTDNKFGNIAPPVSFINKKLFEISFLSSEYLSLNNFNLNDSNLKISEYLFDQAFRKYIKDTASANFQDACTLGEASLDLYKTTNNQNYLNLAKFIWKHQNIPLVTDYQFSYMSDKAVCAYFANDLYKTTKDLSIKDVKDKMLDTLITKTMDLKGNQHYLTGDACFDEIEEGSIHKFSSENSLIINLLLDN